MAKWLVIAYVSYETVMEADDEFEAVQKAHEMGFLDFEVENPIDYEAYQVEEESGKP